MRKIDADMAKAMYSGCRDFCRKIDSVPTIPEFDDGWYDADIEIPVDDQQVLVCKELKSGKRTVALGYYARGFTNALTGQRGAWVTTGCQRVVSWMPLPEPPEKEAKI